MKYDLLRHCIKKWLRLKNVCPLCHRQVFRGDNDQNGENQAEGHQADVNQNDQNQFFGDFDDEF